MNLNRVNFVNNFILSKELDINGLRSPKIISFNEKIILLGSKIYNSHNSILKYLIYFYILNDNFNVETTNHYFLDFNFINQNYFSDLSISSWVRNIYTIDNYVYLNIEFKNNIDNKYFIHENYLIKTFDFKNFTVIKKYDQTGFVFFEYNDNIISSSIIVDNQYIWGKYLFNFINKNIDYKPIFDKIIDYKNDDGHVANSLFYDIKTQKYMMLFSIRKKIDNYNNYTNNQSFIYNIYISQTDNFIEYYNTSEIIFNKINNNSEFLSYPWFFVYKNKNYIITNQDDFGKEKKILLFEQV